MIKKLLKIFLIVNYLHCYLIEMESDSGKKSCISEVFAIEPFSIIAKVTEKYTNRFNVYITIEDEKKLLLAHQKYKNEEDFTLITYNNEKDQTLFICIDNFENYKIPIELDIRYSHHLNNLDNAPTFGEFDQINNKLEEVKDKINKSHDYFKQNQIYTDKMANQSGNFEFSLYVVSIVSISIIVLIGIIQICILRKDILNKKNW